MTKPAGPPLWRDVKVNAGGETGKRGWGVPAEVPVEIGFNGKPWAVMLASPADFEDLARGLAFTEGVLSDGLAIERFDIGLYPEGITVDCKVPPARLNKDRLKPRMLEGRTGCGLCGVETLADAVRVPDRRVASQDIDDAAVAVAFSELPSRQRLNSVTKSVHGAAWCRPDGGLALMREDVGRHNALDKLIGALLAEGAAPNSGFFLLTSRCSVELVQKAACFGAPLLACLSGPTTRALDLAAAAGLQLRFAGRDGQVLRVE